MHIQEVVLQLLGFVYRQDGYIFLACFVASYSSSDPLSIVSDGDGCSITIPGNQENTSDTVLRCDLFS